MHNQKLTNLTQLFKKKIKQPWFSRKILVFLMVFNGLRKKRIKIIDLQQR